MHNLLGPKAQRFDFFLSFEEHLSEFRDHRLLNFIPIFASQWSRLQKIDLAEVDATGLFLSLTSGEKNGGSRGPMFVLTSK